jgi:hypothetical protein
MAMAAISRAFAVAFSGSRMLALRQPETITTLAPRNAAHTRARLRWRDHCSLDAA